MDQRHWGSIWPQAVLDSHNIWKNKPNFINVYHVCSYGNVLHCIENRWNGDWWSDGWRWRVKGWSSMVSFNSLNLVNTFDYSFVKRKKTFKWFLAVKRFFKHSLSIVWPLFYLWGHFLTSSNVLWLHLHPPPPSSPRELKRERERTELWRGLEEHQERRMQMLTEAARNQRNLQERGERGDPSSPSNPQMAHSDQAELKPGGASSSAAESAT